MLNYTNAVVTVKENVVVDEEKLSSTKIYAKLMMKAGSKFESVVLEPKLSDFLLSEKGDHFRAEPFVIGASGNIVSVGSKLWCNLNRDTKILVNEQARMFYAELIPQAFDTSKSREVSLG